MIDNYNLCLETLKKLHKAKVLDKITVIGSWCIFFYKEYFKQPFHPTLRTRDIDFLIPLPPPRWPAHVDIPSLLDELGFAVVHSQSTGAIKLSHPMLSVEFLVPEQGRGSDRPMAFPELKINAQRLRFLNYLLGDSITVVYEKLPLRLPHPTRFALHKIIVATRRKNKDKAARDMEQALSLIETLLSEGQGPSLLKALHAMPPAWLKILRKHIRPMQDRFPELAQSMLVNGLDKNPRRG